MNIEVQTINNSYNKETPVLIVPTGKIEIVRQVYEQLKQLKPRRLFLFFDSPDNEEKKAAQLHIQALFDKIEWDCEVKIYNSKRRLGYNDSMLQAARRFFRQVNEGIVLNCIRAPFPAFYAFCSCMLEKYREDVRIGHISSYDFRRHNRNAPNDDSYYFTKLIHTRWGWASWQRVWKDMDAELKTFSTFKKSNLIDEIPTHKAFRFPWSYYFKHNTKWENRYEYLNLVNNRMAIVPNMQHIDIKEYELSKINHPVIMVNPTTEELNEQELTYKIPAITLNEPVGMKFLQKQLLSFKTEANQKMEIPRVIHQVFEDPAGPPSNLLQIAATWKKKMPDWEYRFWNKRMVHDFLESAYPDFCDYYYNYPFDVQRWDAIRYLILYHFGGLYVDFDYECIQPIDVLLTGATCCMGMEPAISSKIFHQSLIVGNALMASKPKHPYMAAIIEDMKSNFSVDYRKGNALQIMESTGPFMTTRVYKQYKKKNEVTLLSADLVAPLSMMEVMILRMQHKKTNTGKKPSDLKVSQTLIEAVTSRKSHELLSDAKKKLENAFAVHYFIGTWIEQANERYRNQKTTKDE